MKQPADGSSLINNNSFSDCVFDIFMNENVVFLSVYTLMFNGFSSQYFAVLFLWKSSEVKSLYENGLIDNVCFQKSADNFKSTHDYVNNSNVWLVDPQMT